MAAEHSFRTKELIAVSDSSLLEPGHWALLWFEGHAVWHKRFVYVARLMRAANAQVGDCRGWAGPYTGPGENASANVA